jgi:uncharacterized glyoxalase superfamily protein PhnB
MPTRTDPWPTGTPCWVDLSVPDLAAAAIGPLHHEAQRTAWTVYLASDDADGTAKLISENGGTVLAEPFDTPWGG